MKTCKKCFREFQEDDESVSLAEELADIFHQDIEGYAVKDLCPQCREDLGIVNILGFGM